MTAKLPDRVDVRGALDRVLRLLSVGSKRFLTTKVDRAVTGLIARQPCAGPLQLTVADVAQNVRIAYDGQVVTSGGRVLCATALGETISAARDHAYELADSIHWDGVYYRRDIGYRAVAREQASA